MSEYYNSQRVKGMYDPKSEESFKLSRSKIDLFLQCPRCFYYDRKLGVGRPPGFPFATLNYTLVPFSLAEHHLHLTSRKSILEPTLEAFNRGDSVSRLIGDVFATFKTASGIK